MGDYKHGFVVVSFLDHERYNMISLLEEWQYVVFTDDRTVECKTTEEREESEFLRKKMMIRFIRQDECWKWPTREGNKNNDHLYMVGDFEQIPYKVWPLERNNNTQDVIVGPDTLIASSLDRTREGISTEKMQSMFRNGEFDRYYMSVQKLHAHHHTKEKKEPGHGSSDRNRKMFAKSLEEHLMGIFVGG